MARLKRLATSENVQRHGDLLWLLPEVITGGCQEDPVGLDGPTLHQEHDVKQDATLPESHQAVQQAAEVD